MKIKEEIWYLVSVVVASLTVANIGINNFSNVNPDLLELVLGSSKFERFADAAGYASPIATTDSLAVPEGSSPFVIDVLDNDYDTDHYYDSSTNTSVGDLYITNNSQISNITGDTGAVITVNPSVNGLNENPPINTYSYFNTHGEITVDTTDSFTGTLSFNYEVCDSNPPMDEFSVDSCAIGQVDVDVLPLSDFNDVDDFLVSTPIDTIYQFKADSFENAFYDPQNEVLKNITIDSLPTNGTLLMYSAPFTLGQQVLTTEVINPPAIFGFEGLQYQPNPGFCGVDSFKWNGGDELYNYGLQSANVNINIPCVNNTPVVTNFNISTPFQTSYLFNSNPSFFEQNFSDQDSSTQRIGESWNFTGIRIITLPTKGELKLNNIPVTANQIINKTNLVNLIYTPNPAVIGTDSFNWVASDNSFQQNTIVVDTNIQVQEVSNVATTNITITDYQSLKISLISNTPQEEIEINKKVCVDALITNPNNFTLNNVVFNLETNVNQVPFLPGTYELPNGKTITNLVDNESSLSGLINTLGANETVVIKNCVIPKTYDLSVINGSTYLQGSDRIASDEVELFPIQNSNPDTGLIRTGGESKYSKLLFTQVIMLVVGIFAIIIKGYRYLFDK